MKRSYWEKMAPSYSEEIFDVLHNDKKALIRKAIEKVASKNKTVIDIGCAIGKWLPLLSPQFKKVIALDISIKNLQIAQGLHTDLTNIEYVRADMSAKKNSFTPCDAGICINAILTPSQKDRDTFFKGLSRCIKKGGTLIMSIPSLESWMLTSVLQQQYKIDKKYFPATKSSKDALRKWNNIKKGNVEIDNVPHKHYLAEELEILLMKAGFKTEAIEKLEYDWSTEFHKAPSWLKKPGPWDWLAIAKKV